MTTITLATVAGLIIGIALGATVAGLALMERRSRHWVVCLRLPEELHRRLREEATVAGWSLKAEIIRRLQVSFGQPNGDQVVDAPPL
jgi:Arc-like DNA binding domain